MNIFVEKVKILPWKLWQCNVGIKCLVVGWTLANTFFPIYVYVFMHMYVYVCIYMYVYVRFHIFLNLFWIRTFFAFEWRVFVRFCKYLFEHNFEDQDDVFIEKKID